MNEVASYIIDKNTGQHRGCRFAGDDPRFVCKDYLHAISEGKIPKHEPWTKVGYSPASTTSETTVWGLGTQYVFPTVPQQMEVVSSDNTQDKTGGTGALSVRIHYLDANYIERTEIVELNGTTEVATVATDIFRINYFRVNTVGSGGKPVGNLSVRHISDSPTYAYILAGYTRARQMFFTVPKNKTLFVNNIAFSAAASAANKNVRFTTQASYDPIIKQNLTAGTFFIGYNDVLLVDGAYERELSTPSRLPEKTDLKVSVIGTAGAVCSTSLSGWIEEL
jgi:hypothetical protein